MKALHFKEPELAKPPGEDAWGHRAYRWTASHARAGRNRQRGDYATLTNAIANGADGDTIALTNNITVSAEVAISAKGLTIEGNNYSVAVPVPGLNDSGVTNASPSTFRVFNINASGKTNTLQNMTVKGGSPSSNGGGILNSSGTLVLQGVTVAQSGGSSCSGGGLENNSGTSLPARLQHQPQCRRPWGWLSQLRHGGQHVY
jgi:hypothetical protein